jgi:nucleotide-binding universal stress UspA family protein
MHKKILVGLDGSNHGIQAAEAAIALAKTSDAELHLLTVTRPYKVSEKLRQFLEAENLLGEPKYVMDEMTSSIISRAEELAIQAGVKNVKTVIREGKPARTLLDYAKGNGIDLIVVGARGVGELEAALLGSVSQKVSMLSPCTVMVVR